MPSEDGASELKQIPLSSLIYELGPHAFSRVESFVSILRAPKPALSGGVEQAIFLNESEVAECLFLLLKSLEQSGDIAIEKFVDALGLVKPSLAWTDVFGHVGELLGDRRRSEGVVVLESGWLLLLRTWQRARLLMTQRLPTEERAEVPPSHRKMFPLSVLPQHPPNRLLSSLVKFLVAHDGHHNSTLIPQTLLETPPSNVLLEVAHNLFYTHSEEAMTRHGLDLLTFLRRRLSNPKECNTFLIKIGVFLQEKLAALTALYVAASQGRDPLKTIDNQTTLILDASKTITYFQAVMDFADSAEASDLLFSESRIVHHFERLRIMAVDVYREDAAVAGLDRRSFMNYLSERRFAEPNRQAPVAEAPGEGDGSSLRPANLHPANIESQEEYFFSCFYRRELSAAQLVDLLRRLASCPPQSTEAQLLSKMLRTLFTECRHFPKYPPSELQRTAEFFGKLIRSELLMKRPELQLLATRCVMEALRKEPSSNIFKFGLLALHEFLELTPTSPVFLGSLTKMPGLVEYFPAVVNWAQQVITLMPPKVRTMSIIEMGSLLHAIAPNQLPSCCNLFSIPPSFQLVPVQAPRPTPESIFGNIAPPLGCTEEFKVRLHGFGLGQVEALMDDSEITHQIADPPDAVKNRVSQVFNTLVKTNISQKARELLCVFQPEWLPWLAFYIVKSRASKEANHHELYAEFAESLGQPRMLDLLTNVTYDCINLLLKFAVSAREATSYRTVVKTLGSWLGRLTIARNKPLKSRSMDLRALLYDSFERGNLIVAVPLVCALLAHVKDSRTFKLPNPWTSSTLICLGNLYEVPRLKQTILFEIELLMRNLDLDLPQFINQEGNLFLSLKPPADSPDIQPATKLPIKISPSVASGYAEDATAPPPALPTTDHSAISSEAATAPSGGQLMAALSKSVAISRSLVIFQRHPELKIAVPLAIERAIRQLIGVISERAVILAVGTTVELVQKDFAMESDSDLVKRAANLMAAALGGSIVSVTGRSPLRLAVIEHFKDLIKSADSISDSETKDDDLVNQTAQVIAGDNLALASLLIEQVVVEQSVKAVQEALAPSLEKRRIKRASNEPFIDPTYFGPDRKWPKALPSILQLTPVHETKKLHIYSDFASVGPLKRVSASSGETADSLIKPSAPIKTTAKQQPLSPMPSAHSYISTKKLLTVEQSLAAIDHAVASLKEGVKELISSPMVLNGAYKVVPLGHLDHMVDSSNVMSPALRALATLPTDHEVFKQMEIVVRLIRHCEQQDDVALSTARRLLRSIYDAANRAVQHAAAGDTEIDISLIYLETFVALLRRFDELQLVHRLKDVVTIWIISASYLALSSNHAPETPEKSIDFRHFPAEVAAHALLVLAVAWKYNLLQISVIDNDFLSVLMKQSIDCITNTETELPPQTRQASEITIEFVLSVVYVLKIDLEGVGDGLNNTLELIKKLALSVETSDKFKPLKNVTLQLPVLLEFQETAGGLTLDKLAARILEPKALPSKPSPRFLTIQDLLKYRAQYGVPTYAYLAVDSHESITNGMDGSTLSQAFQNGKLKTKKSISHAIAHSIRDSLQAK
eukprot:Gregarina_sp_Poly_1__8749@NODE_523_length_7729_cov_225_108588_g414_i0_p1_GENE_NODE_523_length_7729_cov_225_108588_g414_i0NODE_523_length_7729_cov_225_108588_g414_i0_p1_ORF_typecomplete_len1598_score287_46CNOT1_CAF1_bind/PF16415_5/6_9e64CNOT1_TTP_bind/PF16417_5/1_3e03CNOT1_TTP_bind/PF16417_5/3_2e32DUF3819/PF12842_7/1_7e32_NODE_523_length_7729_cov_225_108588_g414_i01054796